MKQSKLSIVKDHMAAGNWQKAISVAAKFPDLGQQRNAILDAHLAYTSPDFCRQIKKDPAALIAGGIEAIKARYP